MMEAINGGQQYMQHGVQMHLNAAKMAQMNLNSVLYGLVTPPRRQGSKGMRTPPPSQRPPSEQLSRSLPKQGRQSPSFYAGAKFGERPPPTQLPKPPTHWVQSPELVSEVSCDQMTHSLKLLLKVQS
ncbi:hypothetical protein JTE90_014955 [Oedothorax gibbosus]|uniref:Uncharacterized protein n=1 Tax=Oedothorax gibbosus TaxID=931172 RepID=A0AAV6UZI0_9ARAC|nr:hypothetical protein JTE90_014955 [Oedothorax gibbosus]